MSLLQQLRPTPWELEKRRWGPRTYNVDENLHKYLIPLSVDQARETRPPPFPTHVHVDEQTGKRSYQTRYGYLDKELMEKFSIQRTWTTENRVEHMQFVPMHKPPDYGNRKLERKTSMVSFRPPRYESGPQEWQKIRNYNDRRDGLVPESKVWPQVLEKDRMFPVYVGTRTNLFRKLQDRSGRTEAEEKELGEYIRDLVKRDKLMPQYVKPVAGEGTFSQVQQQARPDEQLERPADRNPVCMRSHAHAVHRRYPAYEYKRPEFRNQGHISCTANLSHPYNHFNQRWPSLSCKLSDRVPWDKPSFVGQF